MEGGVDNAYAYVILHGEVKFYNEVHVDYIQNLDRVEHQIEDMSNRSRRIKEDKKEKMASFFVTDVEGAFADKEDRFK